MDPFRLRPDPGQRVLEKALRTIRAFYGDRTARRSGLPLINHIEEGLTLLEDLGASYVVQAAWCLHPIVQSDEDLQDARQWLVHQDPWAVVLAMEYRKWANAHLSFHEAKVPSWGSLVGVKLMLITDKVQNRKDFEKHLRDHPEVENAERLDLYFQEWFRAMEISEPQYQKWVQLLEVG